MRRSLDALLGLEVFADPYVVRGIFAFTIIGVVIMLSLRRHEHPEREATQR